MDATGVILALLGAAMVGLIAAGIGRGWFSAQRSSAGFLTGMHDVAPRDKQEAIDVIVERKAGRAWMEQTAGQGKDPAEAGPPEGEEKP